MHQHTYIHSCFAVGTDDDNMDITRSNSTNTNSFTLGKHSSRSIVSDSISRSGSIGPGMYVIVVLSNTTIL